MAVVRNPLLKGISGEIQKGLVLRRMRDKTIMYSFVPASKKPSPLQELKRERFRQAMLYAKSKMRGTDIEIQKAYHEAAVRRGKPNGYTVAVADFYHAPVIENVTVSDPVNGNRIICARVTDDFKVERVSIEILTGEGVLITSGEAAAQGNDLDWIYTTDVINGIVIVKAYDMPGNETVREMGF